MRSLASIVALASILAVSASALAQPKDAREQARALGEKGVALLNEGKYAEALGELEKADALYHATTITFYMGECNKYLGRLVEARASYEKVVGEPLPPDASGPIRASHEKARAELAGVSKRIPWIAIELVPDERASATITVDGKTIAADKIDHLELDPGAHKVQAERATGRTVRAEVTLKEGENKPVRLVLAEAPVGPVAPPAEAESAPSPHPLRTPGFVLLGVGGVGVVIGAITGIASIAKVGSFKDDCNAGGHCPKTDASAGSSASTLATVSDIGFIVGGVGAAAGLTMVLWPGKKDAGTGATTGVFIAPGPGSLSLSGKF